MTHSNKNLFLNEDDVEKYISYPPKCGLEYSAGDIISPALPPGELQIHDS